MNNQTLADTANGPSWLLYALAVLFAVLSGLLLAGKGAWLIAGYNTASEAEKQKYDEKRLCRTMGAGMAFITVLILLTAIFEDVLPASFAFILVILILADVAVMLILSNTYCRIKR